MDIDIIISVLRATLRQSTPITLGALSVQKASAKTKRHPTIKDGVVIYAGATILGGKTIIGQNSIIGGNTWITSSIPAESQVYYNDGNMTTKKDGTI